MINLSLYKNKNVGVIGFGKTGKAIADSLIFSGANVILFDDSGVRDEHYKKFFRDLSDDQWKHIDLLIVSPGIHLWWPQIHESVRIANENNICVRNELDVFQQHVAGKKICVTGTNGKSTTTALINHIFQNARRKVEMGGNIGIPMLSSDNDKDFYVIELSSYTLESCAILGFDTSILLNIAGDHLHRHGGMEGYISAKQKVFANYKDDSNAIIAVDDEYCREIYKFLKDISHPNVIPVSGICVPDFGIGWNEKNQLVDNTNGKKFAVCEHSETLDGSHNRQNIAAAYAASIKNGITTFFFQRVGTSSGICREN